MGSAILVVAAFAALAVGVLIASRLDRSGGRHPKPGEVWYVDMPFSDDWTKSKDRPALVVSVDARTALVCKITSKDKSDRPHEYELVPVTSSGLPKTSWVSIAPERIALTRFRRKVGGVRGSGRRVA